MVTEGYRNVISLIELHSHVRFRNTFYLHCHLEDHVLRMPIETQIMGNLFLWVVTWQDLAAPV